MSINLELQRKILIDKVRNEAYFRALEKRIVMGETHVADLGSGTGFLSFLARRLGARTCDMYEISALAHVSEGLIRLNHLNQCQVFQKDVLKSRSKTPVDLIVSETFGSFALEENIIEIMEAGKRMLKPGGHMIPESMELVACPVKDPKFFDEISLREPLKTYHLKFDPIIKACLNNIYVRSFSMADLWSVEPKVVDSIDFSKNQKSVRTNQVNWTMDRSGTVFGMAVWWKTRLAPGIELSTAPDAPTTHWEQVYFPVLQPMELQSGQTLVFELRTDTRPEVGIRVRWGVSARSGESVVSDQKLDMARGNL